MFKRLYKVKYLAYGLEIIELLDIVKDKSLTLKQQFALNLNIKESQILSHSSELKLASDLSEIRDEDMGIVLVSYMQALYLVPILSKL